MQLGDAWARPLDNTWYVQSTERADVLERRLKPHLDSEDGLLIQQVESRRPAAQYGAALVQQAPPGAAPSTGNVVAFPVPALPEAKAA